MKVRAVIIEADDVSAEDVRVLMQQAFPVLAGGVASGLPRTLPAAAPELPALPPAAAAEPTHDAPAAPEMTAPTLEPARHRNAKLSAGYRPSSKAAPSPARPAPGTAFRCGDCGRALPEGQDRRATCACGARRSWVPTNDAAAAKPSAAKSNGETRPRFDGRAIINPNRVGRPAELDEEDDD